MKTIITKAPDLVVHGPLRGAALYGAVGQCPTERQTRKIIFGETDAGHSPMVTILGYLMRPISS